jgi:deoxyribodipyrimidine photo-lyase
MTTAIWWIRRDLRLTDNQALTHALEQANQVIPLFIDAPEAMLAAGNNAKQHAFLLAGLYHLHEDLHMRGSTLVMRRGDPQHELAQLLAETGAEAIIAEEDYDPLVRQRDAQLARHLPLHLVGGLTVHHPTTILKADGTPYKVYTPFSKSWKTLTPPSAADLLPAPHTIPTPDGLSGLSLPAAASIPPHAASPWPQQGEAAARRHLHAFLGEGHAHEPAPVDRYATDRDRMDRDGGTSNLSPFLRFGILSPRQAVVAALAAIERAAAKDTQAREGAASWLNELIWREFYLAILYHFPQVTTQSFRAEYDRIAWENDEEMFAAWCAGRTGYPLVDAAMRQLTHSGWMHNRARMIVASFLVKDLLIDWRWGERFFRSHLLDGDVAANTGGWQWTAGTGTDAAPYFRVFHPVTQSKKYDPQGLYIHRWVPELAAVPERFIHTPWEMPQDVQERVECMIGQAYPAPIVDHKWARTRALEAYRKARG